MSLNIKVVQPAGLLDRQQGLHLSQEVLDLIDSGDQIVAIDFQDITFVDSAGLAALVTTLKQVRLKNAQLYLCSLNQQAKMLMKLTQVEEIFEILPDRQALESIVPS